LNDELGYENALAFYKILSIQMGSSSKQTEQKITQLYTRFELLNQKHNKMLEFVKFDEAFIKALSQNVKR
jgi:hypothetical protein